MARYREKDHKQAFELYRVLGSFNSVSKQKGIPSPATIMRWSSVDFKCPFHCGWHGYENLENRIQREVREQANGGEREWDETDEKGIEPYVQSDLTKLRIIRELEAEVVNALRNGNLKPPATIEEAQRVLSRLWAEDRNILGLPEQRAEIVPDVKIDIDPILEMLDPDKLEEGKEYLQREYSRQTHPDTARAA